MIELNEQQQQELDRAELTAVDPRTNAEYVLVRKDVYERLWAIVDGATRRAGWDDPALDVYEQYRSSVT
jgi:hypothetical protein